MHQFTQYFQKYEHPYEEGYDAEEATVAVYEFPDLMLMEQFLSVVGGSPHPYGGLRVILAKQEQ